MLDEKDVKKVIAASLRPGLEGVANSETLDEGYIATPKHYSQVSDLVSQRTKDAHKGLYEKYITTLNETSARIDSANPQDSNANSSDYRSLKLDESNAINAVNLHELYFSNCFDPHSELFMDTLAYMRLQRDFGSFDRWQADFLACAEANREGWAVCGYNTYLKRFVNTVIDGHNGNVMLGLIPVIVVDTFAHSYYRDYLDDKKSYIIAMMREFNWQVIEERFKKMEKVHEALK